MPNFDIVKTLQVDSSFRVSKIKSDFGIKDEHVNLHLTGKIDFPETWNIGVIVGGSATGKTTIAKELFGEHYVSGFEYNKKSVIDDMPSCGIDEIEKMFYSVGFGSVPSWLRPYGELSTGEKMRVDLARSLLEKDFVVFDEFTSVVDRNVAQTACIAINKSIRKMNKKFIAVSCHYDILDWLSPDWVFDTNTMKSFFGISLGRRKNFQFKNATGANGKNLGVIII